jgi:hypothetical protein
MLRSLHMLVLALATTLGIASSASAITSETALRANRDFPAHRVTDFGEQAREAHQQTALGYGEIASDSSLAARGAPAASNVLLRTAAQLASKFKHAKDFGVAGNYSKANASAFSRAIHQHVNSPAVRTIQGTLHKAPVTHYVDPSTGLNVISDRAGNFITGWKLSADQLRNVLTHGGL